ncbi:MAG: hypothetical protein JF603_00980 [Acidobacteria bacterium]|nr:hypothetical protein [Acidobacteriota bacterium]
MLGVAMLVACWGAKGGSGTTVVAAALATLLARAQGAALVVDLDGDLPGVLGLPEPDGPGIAEWLAAGEGVPPDALGRLEVRVTAGLALLPAGAPGQWAVEGRGDVLAALLAADPRPVVVDCGSQPVGHRLAVAAAAAHSLLVLRPCALALRRAQRSPLRPSGVVLIDEDGRALGPDDIEAALGVPIRAIVPWARSIARAADGGLLAGRLPGGLARALRKAA